MRNGNAAILVEQAKRLNRDYIDDTRQLQRLQRQQTRLIREATLDVYGALDYLSQSSYRNWDVIDEDINIGATIPPIGKYKLKRGEEIPVYENEYQLWTYQARSRVLCYFNEFAICGIENRLNYIVGEGLTIKAKPVDPKNSRHRRLAERCQEYIDLINDVNDLPEIEVEASQRCDEDGENFIRIFEGDNGIPYFENVEPEHVRPRMGSSWGPHYSFGIETPPQNVTIPINYWIVENPTQSWESEPIPAKEVVHIKYNVKRNSKRGLPTYFPLEGNFRRCEDLLHSMTAMAKTRAKIALLIKMTGVTNSAAQALQDKLNKIRVNDPQLNTTLDLEKFPYGSIIRYSGVQEYQMPSPSIGASDFVEVLQAELRAIASRLEMPEWMFSALPDAKYSNAFVVEAPTLKAFKKLQRKLCNYFGNYKYGHKRSLIWRAIMIGVKNGILDSETPECVNVECSGPSLETREKQQEASTNKIYNDMGIKSKKTIQSELSLDSESEEDNFISENVKDDIEQAKSTFTQVMQVQTAVYANQMPRDAALGLLNFIGIDDETADKLVPEKQESTPGQTPGSGDTNLPAPQPGVPKQTQGIPESARGTDRTSDETATDTGEAFDLSSAVDEFWDDIGINQEQLTEQHSTGFVRLLEKGFTGTITDKLGRKIKYVEGKRVTGDNIPVAKKLPTAKLIPTAKKIAQGIPIVTPVMKKKIQKTNKVAATKTKKILTLLGKLYKEVNPKHAKQVKKAYNKAAKKYGPTLAKLVVATAIVGLNTSKLAQFSKDATEAVYATANFFNDISGRVKKAVKAFTEQHEIVIVEQYTKKVHFDLLEAGFTGTIKDSRGREFYYENGKRVKHPYNDISAEDVQHSDTSSDDITHSKPKTISDIIDKRTTNPVSVKLTIRGDETVLKDLFGEKPDIQTFLRVGNALSGDETVLSLQRSTQGQLYVDINSQGESGESLRTIYKDDNGDLVLNNSSYMFDKNKVPEEYKGLTGADIFARQVEAARALGIKRINTIAVGNKQTAEMKGALKANGYYTWPRLGYDGVIPYFKITKMPDNLRLAMGDKENILTLYSIPGGKEWWKENGGSLSLSFDLDENSQSYKTLMDYLEERKNKNV